MKILVIDDEEDIRLIARLALVAGGHQFVGAGGGEEGIVLARSERPDAIVLDVMMPDMDGIATLERLKRDPDLARIPVVILTAKPIEADGEPWRVLGAAGVISKPFHPAALARKVEELIGS